MLIQIKNGGQDDETNLDMMFALYKNTLSVVVIYIRRGRGYMFIKLNLDKYQGKPHAPK
ncbi:hypothetical protein P7L78_00765 (plasmid) [Tistrella bauzanensis]|uniref:Uncharacterized protein n=1 Tax=Tistrella arctica TaxID=3133430 RepID=A0ABU9YKP9_9PROT